MQWFGSLKRQNTFGQADRIAHTRDIEDGNSSDCKGCEQPCEVHPHYPEALASKVDQGNLHNSVKPYSVHVLVCTGHTNWPEKVEKEMGSLVQALDRFSASHAHLRLLISACDQPTRSLLPLHEHTTAASVRKKASTINAGAKWDLLVFPPAVRLFDVTVDTVEHVLARVLVGAVVIPSRPPPEPEREKEKEEKQTEKKREEDATTAAAAVVWKERDVEEEVNNSSAFRDTVTACDETVHVAPGPSRPEDVQSESFGADDRHILICSHKLRDKRCGVFGKRRTRCGVCVVSVLVCVCVCVCVCSCVCVCVCSCVLVVVCASVCVSCVVLFVFSGMSSWSF